MARKKVLLIIEQCNPNWASVPLVAYNFFKQISKIADVTLVTHGRNKADLDEHHPNNNFIYIHEPKWAGNYYKLISKLTTIGGRTAWPLLHLLSYPIYSSFNKTVNKRFKAKITNGDFDIVHAITPMMPRYGYKVAKSCKSTPLVIGPINGGVPFPKGFGDIAKKEFSQFNFFRKLGDLLNRDLGRSYESADLVIAGSNFTLQDVASKYSCDEKMTLMWENGIDEGAIDIKNFSERDNSKLKLIFVGRLVPYKGADMLLNAIASLPIDIRKSIELHVVGDGSEMNELKQLAKVNNISDIVRFHGWVAAEKVKDFYSTCDLFCFPSIREFGGAVVMEAMAKGLPCVVVDNGGVGEYVTEQTGFKITPNSREYIEQEVKKAIELFFNDISLLKQYSKAASERARSFTWERKRSELEKCYEGLFLKNTK